MVASCDPWVKALSIQQTIAVTFPEDIEILVKSIEPSTIFEVAEAWVVVGSSFLIGALTISSMSKIKLGETLNLF